MNTVVPGNPAKIAHFGRCFFLLQDLGSFWSPLLVSLSSVHTYPHHAGSKVLGKVKHNTKRIEYLLESLITVRKVWMGKLFSPKRRTAMNI